MIATTYVAATQVLASSRVTLRSEVERTDYIGEIVAYDPLGVILRGEVSGAQVFFPWSAIASIRIDDAR